MSLKLKRGICDSYRYYFVHFGLFLPVFQNFRTPAPLGQIEYDLTVSSDDHSQPIKECRSVGPNSTELVLGCSNMSYASSTLGCIFGPFEVHGDDGFTRLLEFKK